MAERWDWLAEGTLCLSLGPPAEIATQRRLLDLSERLAGTPGLIDRVPGVHSLSLIADPARLPALALERLAKAAWRRARPAREARRELRVPVQYGGDGGPDLAEASRLAALSPAQLIEAHAAPRYEVACLGFLPGFAYLLGLPKVLHLPRRAAPRLRVPAGSVGIGGAQTGIYPLDSPGGWQLIGHSRLALFDAERSPATLLLPGDWLRFEPLPHA
jgi:KipI family sensor histidine kinase inhibitor